ncbi:MAG: ATP-binding protein, partial [Melioribacteraceae bacterium]
MFFISNGLITDCNPAVLDILKCERDFVLGHSPADFSPELQPDGRRSTESANEKIGLTFIGIPQRFYWQHKRKDGSLVDSDISLRAVTIEGKKIIQATMRDITEIKRSEKFRQVLFDISETAYIAPDMSSLYKHIHEKIAELMPVKNIYLALYDEKTNMISFPYFVDEYDPPQLPKKLSAGLTEYILRKGEAELINAQKDLELRKAGEVELIGEPAAIWLGVPLKLSGKTIGVIVVQDYENETAYGEEEMQILTFVSEQIAHVIERKGASEAIKKYAEELKQLNNTKDKFFSIIAHDLRNPFITILGFSDLLISDFDDLTDDEKIFYISEMKKSAETSHNLLQNLLQWSRAQTGRIEFNPLKLDLAGIVTSNVELLTPHASRKQIQINSAVPENVFVLADEDMLNTILRNLITNAIKFTETNGLINIDYEDGADQITVCVSDNGVGMSPAVKEKLFKADENQTTMGTAHETGTGLGLILCKEFIEKHGCIIWVESEVGKGSKFCFTLPKAV